MSIDELIWELEPHTIEKHKILRYYLGAWFPILGSVHSRVLYVDGFAGPGEYKGGEHGSPIIALEVARNHVLASKFNKELVFLFIEKDSERADHLENLIRTMPLPTNFKVKVESKSFEDSIGEKLDDITEREKKLAPSFFFIDPFGPDGFPISLMAKIADQPRSEVLINFSYQPLNQWFLQDERKHSVVDGLFGGTEWREVLSIQNPKEKEEFIRIIYQKSLEKLGWKIRPFKMINRHNQTQYYLYFATKNPLGMLAMKRAMWQAAPTGEFSYHDLSNPNQTRLLDSYFDETYSQELAEKIFTNNKGTYVTKQKLVKEDLAWDPICLDRHLTSALRILEYENPPRIIDVANRKKRGSYPDKCEIRFAESKQSRMTME